MSRTLAQIVVVMVLSLLVLPTPTWGESGLAAQTVPTRTPRATTAPESTATTAPEPTATTAPAPTRTPRDDNDDDDNQPTPPPPTATPDTAATQAPTLTVIPPTATAVDTMAPTATVAAPAATPSPQSPSVLPVTGVTRTAADAWWRLPAFASVALGLALMVGALGLMGRRR